MSDTARAALQERLKPPFEADLHIGYDDLVVHGQLDPTASSHVAQARSLSNAGREPQTVASSWLRAACGTADYASCRLVMTAVSGLMETDHTVKTDPLLTNYTLSAVPDH